MLNDIYYNPTKIFFGKGEELRVGAEVAKYSKNILLHYGGGSCKKSGLLDIIKNSLVENGVNFTEFGGVVPNPRDTMVYEGINLCREKKIDFILAVGGGSVIDSAKAIGMGVPYEGDFFDFFINEKTPETTLPVATVLTLPGAGSESSKSCVITFESRGRKLSVNTDVIRPVFSILNPEFTYTVPMWNTMCGITDAIAHTLERYFTNTEYVDCTDRMCEGLIKTLMKYGLLVKESPNNYQIRAEIMWACKLAHDNSTGFGREQDWACHKIQHELGAVYDMSHGAGLAAVIPAWMKFVGPSHLERFVQFGHRIFGIDIKNTQPDVVLSQTICCFSLFLKSIGMPVRLTELGIYNKSNFEEMAEKAVSVFPSKTIGYFEKLTKEDIVKILEIAY